MTVPIVVWLPLAVTFLGLFVYQAILDGSGGRHAREGRLRRYFLLGGLALICLGAVMLYYAPHGGRRIRSETESRIYGSLILCFGIATCIQSRSREEKLRDMFEQHTSERRIIPDPERYVSPRDRVMGIERDQAGGDRKPWE